jgi:hypothetical protein
LFWIFLTLLDFSSLSILCLNPAFSPFVYFTSWLFIYFFLATLSQHVLSRLLCHKSPLPYCALREAAEASPLLAQRPWWQWISAPLRQISHMWVP